MVPAITQIAHHGTVNGMQSPVKKSLCTWHVKRHTVATAYTVNVQQEV